MTTIVVPLDASMLAAAGALFLDVVGVYPLTAANGPAAGSYAKHGFRPAGRQSAMTRF